MRGIIPLDRVPCAGAACPHRTRDAVHRHGQPRFRRGDRRLRRAASATAPAPGSTRASAASIAVSTSAAIAIPSRSMTAINLVGGLYGVSLGARVLRREHVSPRARRLQDRAGAPGRAPHCRRLPAARHAIRHGSSQELRRGRGAAAALSRAAGSGRSPPMPISPRSPRTVRSVAPEALDIMREAESAAKRRPRIRARLLRARRRCRCGVRRAAVAGRPRALRSAGASATAGLRAAFTVGEPHVVDRMLDRVQAGLAANIQPVKMRLISPCSVTSSTSTKASVFGGSVGGRE